MCQHEISKAVADKLWYVVAERCDDGESKPHTKTINDRHMS